MITSVVSTIIVVTPAMTIINVIWQSRELHKKYYFFIAYLLATSVIFVIFTNILIYLTIILYLLGLNSNSAVTVLKWLGIAPFTLLFYLMSILSPIPVDIERMIVIAFPLYHRTIMTNKTVARMLAAMWGTTAIVSIMIIALVPIDTDWSLTMIRLHPPFHAIVAVYRLTSIICTVAANGILQYKLQYQTEKLQKTKD